MRIGIPVRGGQIGGVTLLAVLLAIGCSGRAPAAHDAAAIMDGALPDEAAALDRPRAREVGGGDALSCGPLDATLVGYACSDIALTGPCVVETFVAGAPPEPLG